MLFPIRDQIQCVDQLVERLCPFPTIIKGKNIAHDKRDHDEITHVHVGQQSKKRTKTVEKIFTQFVSKLIGNDTEKISKEK